MNDFISKICYKLNFIPNQNIKNIPNYKIENISKSLCSDIEGQINLLPHQQTLVFQQCITFAQINGRCRQTKIDLDLHFCSYETKKYFQFSFCCAFTLSLTFGAASDGQVMIATIAQRSIPFNPNTNLIHSNFNTIFNKKI